MFALCVALSLMLRVKDSLPEGTIAAAFAVGESGENSSESDLWVISCKRLLVVVFIRDDAKLALLVRVRYSQPRGCQFDSGKTPKNREFKSTSI